MKAVITGGTGFAGSHLAEHCRAQGDDVAALSRAGFGDLRAALTGADVVYHLAAQAHVGRSWEEPEATLHDNLALAVQLFEAVRAVAPEATVVAVSSGEVYGPPAELPVTESAPLRPQNPYAVSKAATDLLARF